MRRNVKVAPMTCNVEPSLLNLHFKVKAEFYRNLLTRGSFSCTKIGSTQNGCPKPIFAGLEDYAPCHTTKSVI